MTDHSPPPLAWVYKRDGRLAPFEPDKISRSLFAATEHLGRPDAFTARELADGVVHFVAAEADGGTPTTELIADTVVKVVRELGHPELARAFAEARQVKRADRAAPVAATTELDQTVAELVAQDLSPVQLSRQVGAACLCQYSLREVFTRDLVSAQSDGLLSLNGLEAPLELAACLLALRPDATLFEAIEAARSTAGQVIAVDGLDYRTNARAASADVRELRIALQATGLLGIINLNTAAPPSWADALAEGPLFAGHADLERSDRGDIREQLLEHLMPSCAAGGPLRIDWHLGDGDISLGAATRLLHVARCALNGAALTFVFDRPRRPVHLAEGIDRDHPAVLLSVRLHLPRLLEQSGVRGNPERFLQKLGSLARLALSAAVQKRDFLRRRGRHWPAFLLGKARLLAVPVGLGFVVRQLTGNGLSAGGPGLDLARQIVRRLAEVFRLDGTSYRLETIVDSDLLSPGLPLSVVAAGEEQVRGLTDWESTADLKNQARTAGLLHGVVQAGTGVALIGAENPPSAETVADLLRYAWKHTEIVRLLLARVTDPPRQLAAPWDG